MNSSREQQLQDIADLRDPKIKWQTRQKTVRKWCYYIFWDALKKGVITRADRCEQCGGKTRGRDLDGHHESYYEPIKVEWLCRTCHRDRHLKAA